jgi:hypothetical protein
MFNIYLFIFNKERHFKSYNIEAESHYGPVFYSYWITLVILKLFFFPNTSN